MSDRIITEPIGIIEQATVLLGAARNSTGPLRPYYTAQARLAFEAAAREMEQLGAALKHVETELEREARSDG